jgi:hypothetical protein
VTPLGVGSITQGAFSGKHGQPVHRGPDGVLDAVAAAPVEHADVNQLVERRAELAQGRSVRSRSRARGLIGMLLRQGERGREKPRFLAGELQICHADRGQPTAGSVGIAVPAGHAGDGGGHPVSELAHGRRADRGEKLVTVGEVPVGGVGNHAHHSGRLAEDDTVRTADAGQFQSGGDEAIADGTPWTALPLGLTCSRWCLADRHDTRILSWPPAALGVTRAALTGPPQARRRPVAGGIPAR